MAKRGRKPKDRNLDETPGEGSEKIKTRNWLGKRNIQYSVAEKIRDRVDPDLIVDYWVMILKGQNPLWEDDPKSPHGTRVIPDPNPMLPTPTLEQRTRAVQELTNRGWGLAVQSIQIDAQLKQTLELGIPAQLLEQANYKALAIIRDALRLEDGNTEDAEWSPVPTELQEPCQTETPADSPQNEELKEACQEPALNENSAPGDDPSAL